MVKDKDENFVLSPENLAKQFYATMDEAHKEIEKLEQEVMVAEAEAKKESDKLQKAQVRPSRRACPSVSKSLRAFCSAFQGVLLAAPSRPFDRDGATSTAGRANGCPASETTG